MFSGMFGKLFSDEEIDNPGSGGTCTLEGSLGLLDSANSMGKEEVPNVEFDNTNEGEATTILEKLEGIRDDDEDALRRFVEDCKLRADNPLAEVIGDNVYYCLLYNKHLFPEFGEGFFILEDSNCTKIHPEEAFELCRNTAQWVDNG